MDAMSTQDSREARRVGSAVTKGSPVLHPITKIDDRFARGAVALNAEPTLNSLVGGASVDEERSDSSAMCRALPQGGAAIVIDMTGSAGKASSSVSPTLLGSRQGRGLPAGRGIHDL
jgi:hypothetical protein